jgi:hypothetical protein
MAKGKACPVSGKKECPKAKKECPVSKEAAKKPQATAEERFKMMDTNKDGKISEAEFVAAHKKWPEAKAKEIYNSAGGTKKGMSLDEYRKAREAWHKKMAEHKRK